MAENNNFAMLSLVGIVAVVGIVGLIFMNSGDTVYKCGAELGGTLYSSPDCNGECPQSRCISVGQIL